VAGLILFFSRGRGRGHALADIEIAHAIQARSPETDVRFVSYATGAETFAAHGVSHIDLGLPERNPINETIVLAGKLIGGLNPDIVLAHEEFMALPAAKIFDKPTVLITDWFAESEKFAMGSLRLADRILFSMMRESTRSRNGCPARWIMWAPCFGNFATAGKIASSRVRS
jgi:hypothetical protein